MSAVWEEPGGWIKNWFFYNLLEWKYEFMVRKKKEETDILKRLWMIPVIMKSVSFILPQVGKKNPLFFPVPHPSTGQLAGSSL